MAVPALKRTAAAAVGFVLSICGADWTRFRGPNGNGVGEAVNLPEKMDPGRALWRTPVPPGFSSPVLSSGRVFLTAWEDRKAWTIALDQETGGIAWKTEAPAPLPAKVTGPNSPVSPSPATDGQNLYVFFPHFGLISYDTDGRERWRHPLGPFDNPYGMGASPIVVDGRLILLCDQDRGSFLLAVSTKDGRTLWRTERAQATHSFSTPVVYRPKKGEPEVVVSGAFELSGYSLNDGNKLWWITGMAWQAKSTPVIAGDTAYVNSWMASLSELGHQEVRAGWSETLQAQDKDKDGRIAKEEVPDPTMVNIWFLYDLDKDGFLNQKEWEYILARSAARNGLYAIRLGGRGDVTRSHVLWRYEKSLPNIPSPLLYREVLYVLKEGGILTALDPKDGSVRKQARLPEALGTYFASPIASAGKLYTASQEGKLAVLRAGSQWDVLSVAAFEEEIWATPALAADRMFVRTERAVYCFGAAKAAVDSTRSARPNRRQTSVN